MQEKRVIYIQAIDQERPHSASVLLHDAKDCDVIVIVPAEDVFLTSIQLPNMSRSRLQQALPYALEEQLIDDVEKLHFAMGDYQSDKELTVAVVSHEKMQQWLSLLKSWGVRPDVLIPLTYALPFNEEEWSLCIQEMAVIRTSALQGVACDKTNLTEVLDLALAGAKIKPSQCNIHNYSSQPVSEKIQRTIPCKETMLPSDQLITDITQQAGETPFINLLQGRYAVKKSKLPALDFLSKTTWSLAKLVLLFLFLYPLGSLFILNNRVKSIDAEITAIYKQQFPNAVSVVAPKMRIQEKLNKLEAQIGENRPLLLLGYIGKSMKETAGIQLKRLDYQQNQMTLVLSAASTSDFSAFTDFLSNSGLTVKQQNTALAGARVNATIQVE